MEIRSAAVIGAGVMGSGIAAHIANAGIPVFLLDIVPQDVKDGRGNDRSVVARSAIERMLKTEPAAFTHKRNARLVTPGNIDDDLEKLAGVDWIIEAVVENPAVKSALYSRLDAVRKPGSIVSSNTSTIPLENLIEGQSARFAQDFMITHFFNPPRYMRLLEVVAGPDTRPDAVAGLSRFADTRLGKGVVACKDRPGFIANRIGTYWIQAAINEAMDLGLTIEEADAVVGRPMGIPKTGVFGLVDLVGLDLMPYVSRSLLKTLPPDDPYRSIHREPELFTRMIAEGYTGRKGKGGFYRMNKSGGGRVKEAIDLSTGQYRTSEKATLESVGAAKQGLRALVEHPDKGGTYARRVLTGVLGYAASLVPEIADDITAVDQAMRLGYNWKYGPFELIDQLGADWLADALRAEGKPVPALLERAVGKGFYLTEGGKRRFLTADGGYADIVRPEGVLLLSDIKLASKPIKRNGSAALWDIGDGVVCLEFTGKMNALDGDVMALIQTAIGMIGDGQDEWKALVVHNEGDNFSVGVNLGLALFAINIAMWPQVEQSVQEGQETYKALKYAPFPVVAAPSGMALGGGCEILLHCDAVQAHVETYMGLVEVGVGVIPGWGGCKEMLTRATLNKKRPGGPMPPIAQVFETISLAKVAKSAEEARDLMFLRPTDGITMNRDRLLADAKAKALELAKDYAPPEPVALRLPGPTARAALDLAVDGFRLQGKATPHDVVVSSALAGVLSGGDTDITVEIDEDGLLELERAAFLKLVRSPATIARIEHMLGTGKPLRN
jgi:3-hydroxyacyl-CoA dehydrogenase